MLPGDATSRLRLLDELAQSDTVLGRRSPYALLALTLLFILTVISFPVYTVSALLPLLLYPLYALNAAEVPGLLVRQWLKGVMPLLLGLGVLNPFIDDAPVMLAGGFSLAAGWLSFLSLLLKGGLTITAGLCLVAACGLPRLALALRRFGVPELLVLQLLLMSRYLSLLLEEGSRIHAAWRLRSAGTGGLSPTVWGPLMGQWLLRSLDRSRRIYQAMRLRGFSGAYPLPPLTPMGTADWRFLILWSLFFLTVRLINLPQFLGLLLTGGLS